jgi:hypothetical protein
LPILQAKLPKPVFLRFLTLLSICFFLCRTSCGDDCESYSLNGSIEVTLENPAERYAVGETIWLTADFSATQNTTYRNFTISENGGLFVSQLFVVWPDSSILTPGLDSFSLITELGLPLRRETTPDPAAALLQYGCPGGRCSFRQGFRAEKPGTYLLRVNGSAIDVESEAFEYCNQPTINHTTLLGGANLANHELALPLNYPLDLGYPLSPIDTSYQQNIFLITVE